MEAYESNLPVVNSLEELMVQQFRGLQNLVEITKAERQALLHHSAEVLTQLIEQKEAQLDQLSLLEDGFRNVVHNMALTENIEITDDSSLQDILPYLPGQDGEKLNRLADGIINMVRHARDLNLGNQTLVQTQLDWVQACRSYLFEGLQTADIYSHPAAPAQRLVVSGMEYRV